MANLTINGTEHEAKFNFLFSKKADEKYGEIGVNGNRTSGFHAVYMGLLQSSNDSLAAFWDCGLAHLKGKEKPSIEDIQEAIAERAEVDEDTIPQLKEAYRAIDESGFFKQQSKKLWSNLEMMKTTGDTEEEIERNLKVYNMLMEARNELTA